jgi:hypothetical protein
MTRISFAVLLTSLSLGSLAVAETIDFSTPAGSRGSNSATYTSQPSGTIINATGFNAGSGSPAFLFDKNSGGNENGVGFNNPDHDFEIWFVAGSGAIQDFIQVDLLPLLNQGYTGFKFAMNSSTSPDAWQVSACSAAGVQGSNPCSNGFTVNGTDQGSHSAPTNLSLTNHFLDFSATGGNVLLASISANAPSVPEPRFYGILMVGMLALAGIVLRKRRAAEQA